MKAADGSALATSARVAGFEERSIERIRRYLLRCPSTATAHVAAGAVHVVVRAGVEVIFHPDLRPARALPLECPNYDPLPRSRRCASFAAGGGCRQPEACSCPEWLRCALDDSGAPPAGGAR